MIVVIAVLVMVFLGFWQLDRHSEKSNINERISLRLDNEPLALADLDILRNDDSNQIEDTNIGASLFRDSTNNKIVF